MIRIFIYLMIFCIWVYTVYFDLVFVHWPHFSEISWLTKLKFLTSINMVVETIYFGTCLIRACIDTWKEPPNKGPHKKHPGMPSYYPTTKLHVICDNIYALVAFPLGLITSILFWSLYAVDRELIYPKLLDEIIPNWMNHVWHTAPAPFMLVDTLLLCHKYPEKSGHFYAFLLGSLYSISLPIWRHFDGYWAYPMLDAFTFFQAFLFLLLAPTVFVIFYSLGDCFNRLVWGPASHPAEQKLSNAQQQMKKAK